MPDIWNQDRWNSCVAHTAAAALEYALLKEGDSARDPSRLFIWYAGRHLELALPNADQNVPIQIRSALKVLAHLGAPPENDWPYDPEHFASQPPPSVYYAASFHKALVYFRVDRRRPQLKERLKAVLAGGLPICFGFHVYPSFNSELVEQTGRVPMPSADEEIINNDDHAALLVGYDEPSRRFIVRNSWGSSWGQEGYFTLPYSYLCSPRARDFWVIKFAS